MLLCPPVEDHDRVFDEDGGEFVLVEDRRSKCCNLMYGGDVG